MILAMGLGHVLCHEKGLNGMDNYWPMEYYMQERQIFDRSGQFTVRFSNIPALLCAARDLIRLYDRLGNHKKYVMNPQEKFLFDAKTGKIRTKDIFCVNFGELAKEDEICNEFCAPELTLKKQTVYTLEARDWTLAVLLYELFYHSGSPYKGMQSANQVFMEMQEEYQWMAAHGFFTMDENTSKNRPIRGVQDCLVKYWDYYPKWLNEEFTEIFVYGKEMQDRRPRPFEWKKFLNRLKTEFVSCECGYQDFFHLFFQTSDGHRKCPKCGRVLYILTSGKNKIYLSNNTPLLGYQLYPESPDDEICMGRVVENQKQKGVFGIKNLSQEEWNGIFPGGEAKTIRPGGGIPLWPGLSITLQNGDTWSIKGDLQHG